jgi:gluconolactonase
MIRWGSVFALGLGLIVAGSLAAADPPSGDPAILPAGAVLEELWNEGEFTEGVAVGPDGLVYFSDIAFQAEDAGRILKFDPKTGKTTVHCADSGKSNGLFFDAKGRLIAACGANNGHQAIVEIKPDGSVRVLYDKFEGKKFNAPNDLVIDSRGRIFFSDPRYVGAEPLEIDVQGVYRIDLDGSIHRITTPEQISKPNGVHLSPDEKILYIAETDNGSFDVTTEPDEKPQMKMTLNAFELRPDGTLGKKTVLADFGQETGTDGMAVDTQGNIYAAVRMESRHGIVVFSPQGKELAFIPTSELPTNCTFGRGDDGRTLYVTSGGGLYRIPLKTRGFHPTAKPRS